MKSVRLTNDMRDDILLSVRDQWQKENPKPKIEEAEDEFARKMWTKHHGAKKSKELLEFKYPEFLQKTQHIHVAIQGQVQRFHLIEDLPTDTDSYRPPVMAMLDDTDRDYLKYEKVKEAFDEWREAGHALERETRAILESVNTSKQLIELWPQAEPFLPAHIADPDKGVKLPALQISRLNERLGVK